MRLPQQLHEQHALVYLLSWAYSVFYFFALLIQQHGTLSYSILRFLFFYGVLRRSLQEHDGAILTTKEASLREHDSFISTTTPIYIGNMLLMCIFKFFTRVVQDCHKMPKLSLGYPRNQGCPRDILASQPIVGLPLRFRGVLKIFHG